MLDQSFSSANFRKIFDLQNRAGHYLEGRYFPELEKLSRQLKSCAGGFKKLKAKLNGFQFSRQQYDDAKAKLNKSRQGFEAKKEELLTQELERIAQEIAKPSFGFRFRKATLRGGKKGYVADPTDPVTFFCIKQLQSNLRSVFKVKQGNRHAIVSHLKSLLGDKFPKSIVRTDLEDFYESVDQRALIKEVMAHSLLSLTSKRFLQKYFDACPGSGLPRGIGLSALLSEVSLMQMDRRIQDMPDVIYYGRYVDDIIVLFSSQVSLPANIYEKRLTDLIRTFDHTHNQAKTFSFNLPDGSQPRQFEYLGYRLNCKQGGGIEIGLSSRRVQKYKLRIARAFDDYSLGARHDEKSARRLLINRLQFLTSNTRLANNKKHVYVGAFFSNPHISDLTELRELDAYLQRLNSRRGSAALRQKIQNFSFVAGHAERRFAVFTPHELEQIGTIWSDA